MSHIGISPIIIRPAVAGHRDSSAAQDTTPPSLSGRPPLASRPRDAGGAPALGFKVAMVRRQGTKRDATAQPKGCAREAGGGFIKISVYGRDAQSHRDAVGPNGGACTLYCPSALSPAKRGVERGLRFALQKCVAAAPRTSRGQRPTEGVS
jgi:hypothetical protein